MRTPASDGVAVRARHLLPVDARQHRGFGIDAQCGQLESAGWPGRVEARGPVARELDVLDLVLAHGHHVRAIEQDVRGHQHRIGEESEVGGEPARHLVLVGVGALEVREGHHRAEDPVQLEHLRHVALAEERGARRIDAQREEARGGLERERPRPCGVADRRQRVQVGDEVERLARILKADELPHRSDPVAEVEPSRRLQARDDAHVSPAPRPPLPRARCSSARPRLRRKRRR